MSLLGPVMNVLRIIPGSDLILKDHVVIVSDRYDRLGVGAASEICYGAEDDASGNACMLKVTKVLGLVGLSLDLREPYSSPLGQPKKGA